MILEVSDLKFYLD